MQTAVEANLQFTAHAVGDGAVHALLDAYEEVDKATPIRKTRPCLTHANFMSKEAVELLPKLGVCVDVQPVWLYLDARTLVGQFGYDRLRYFQPLREHLRGRRHRRRRLGPHAEDRRAAGDQPLRPVARHGDGRHAQGPLVRRPTSPRRGADARAGRPACTRRTTPSSLFLDDKVGSLEVGKLADLIVLDRDPLTCPADDLRETKVLRTYLGGKPVFAAK